MQIFKIGFPAIILDNDMAYFNMLQAVIESVDEHAEMRIVKKLQALSFTISTSHPQYTQPLLQEILNYHTMMGLKLVLSKSIRTTSTIQFDINTI